MYEHPYLAYRVTGFEQEQVAQAAERRRFLIEHADQIVPRAAGPMRRLVDRMLGRTGDRAGSASRTAAARAADTDRRVPAGCEAVPAR